jgi:hypothetical protein
MAMRLNVLLLVAGLLSLIFGLAFLLIPGAMLPLYGIQPDSVSTLLSRFFGAALIQLGLTLYLVRNIQEIAARRALVLAGAIGSITGAGVALIGQLNGIVNALGWSTVFIYGLLLLGYLSFMSSRRQAAGTSAS